MPRSRQTVRKTARSKKTVPVSSVSLADLVSASGINAGALGSMLESLRKAGISVLRDLFKGNGGEAVGGLPLSTQEHSRLLTLAKFAFASDNLFLSTKLFDKDFGSLSALARMPMSRVEKALGTLTESEKASLRALHKIAKTVRQDVATFVNEYNRSLSADGTWFAGPRPVEKAHVSNNESQCVECECCGENGTVFSPRAYLFALLDLIYDCWGISTTRFEEIFLQDIDGLECENGLRPVSQIQLADEVLEKYLSVDGLPDASAKKGAVTGTTAKGHRQLEVSEPVENASWPEAFNAACKSLLVFADVTAESLADQVNSDLKSSQPTCATVDRVVQGVREIYVQRLDTENPPNKEILKSEFDYRAAAIFAPAFATYRKTLLGRFHPPTEVLVNDLENELFISLRAGVCHITTRYTQLIESLQSFILSIRTGESDYEPYPVEEMEWHWLSNYSTWASHMYALVYPENVLPAAFDDLVLQLWWQEWHDQPVGDFVKKLKRPSSPVAVMALYRDYVIPPRWQKTLVYLLASGGLLKRFELEDSDESAAWASSIIYRTLGRFGTEESSGDLEVHAKDFPENGDEWSWLNDPDKQNTVNTILREINNRYNKTEIPTLGKWATDLLAVRDRYCSNSVDGTETLSEEERIAQELLFPLAAALGLNRTGEYAAAHDWYRRLYDPFKPDDQSEGNWLKDLSKPKDIAGIGKDVYLRHTILMMVKDVLDWADHEYAMENPESLNRARDLYLMAKRILQAPDLGGKCFQAIKGLEHDVINYMHRGLKSDGIRLPEGTQYAIKGARASVRRLSNIRQGNIRSGAITNIRAKMATVKDPNQWVNSINRIVDEAVVEDRNHARSHTIREDLARHRNRLDLCENILLGIWQADSVPSTGDSLDSTDDPRWNLHDIRRYIDDTFGPGYGGHLKSHTDTRIVKFGLPIAEPPAPGETLPGAEDEYVPEPPVTAPFCVPANPLLKSFHYRIESSLLKLNNCLSIAGEHLPSRPLTCGTTTDMMNILSSLATRQGTLNDMLPLTEPPRYRYSFLAEKARQYVEVAQRLSGALLQALEKKDEAEYRSLLARHAVELASARVSLRQLVVREAIHAQDAADLQLIRARTQKRFWDNRIRDGMLSDNEKLGLGLMLASAGFQGAAVLPAAIAGGVGTGVSIAGGVTQAHPLIGVGLVLLGGSTAALAATAPLLGGALGTLAGAVNQYAAYERRWEEWKLQDALADIDHKIASVGVTLAWDRVDIAEQELQIAGLEHAQTREVLNFFLQDKFGNEVLYEWMIGILMDLYRAVMQIATSIARLAQRALEFERQGTIGIILGDYWSINAAGLSHEQKQSGLLGAERLITDLTRLDAYKLQTDKRRLQITKTISMARMLSTELVKLRQEGSVTFNTLMEWFDWDFPGHYLRLIKSVKVTAVALVPPIDGIHAMLSNDGESSVVVRENGEFVKTRAMRAFGETIALDSPYNETGLFVLNYDDPMFLPFEGLGVETQWTLELPRATNRFNVDTIVDVLFTIEYTALHSPEYKNQVRTTLGDSLKIDIPIDVANLFPDQWYHLKNPSRNMAGLIEAHELKISLPPTLFPPNLKSESLRVTHLQLIVVGKFGDKDKEHAVASTIRHAIEEGITISKGNLTFSATETPPIAPATTRVAFRTSDLRDSYAFFSTRKDGDKGDQDSPLPDGIGPGGEWIVNIAPIIREFWRNIPGDALPSTLPESPPDDFEVLTNLEGGANRGEDYVSRIRGYLKAPIRGDYTFWLASDDQGEFYLSRDRDPANRQRIAYVSDWTLPGEWNKEKTQKSLPVTLKANEEYYFEVRHKEGRVGDHVAVGWSKPREPDTAPSEIIPGSCISPFYCKPLIDRIDDIILVLTVEGTVRWSA